MESEESTRTADGVTGALRAEKLLCGPPAICSQLFTFSLINKVGLYWRISLQDESYGYENHRRAEKAFRNSRTFFTWRFPHPSNTEPVDTSAILQHPGEYPYPAESVHLYRGNFWPIAVSRRDLLSAKSQCP